MEIEIEQSAKHRSFRLQLDPWVERTLTFCLVALVLGDPTALAAALQAVLAWLGG